jgi:phospholipase A1
MLRQMFLKVFLCLNLTSLALAREADQIVESTYGSIPRMRFSFHQPTYFVFGKDDLKMQFSAKYRLARSIPVYVAFTQLMFWDIYDNSRPFRDTNYGPEIFYRLIENLDQSLGTLDVGYLHNSNGKSELASRSIHRLYIRANYFTKISQQKLNLNFVTYKILNQEKTNEDIVNHIGFWEVTANLSELIYTQFGSFALEVKAYAGAKVFDLDQGGNQIGLLFYPNSEKFNLAIYFQRFEGYSESLIDYNKKRTVYRLGFNLPF